ncbi:MAG: VWA domain-containing protein [Nitrospirae bacterium]|nr:VWA domain-containing protein [Nitrospirota bacterium]
MPFTFLHPKLLWLAPFVALALYLKLRRGRAAYPYPGLAGLQGLPKARFVSLPAYLLALASLMFLAAAMQPRMEVTGEEVKIEGVDVALALDVSGSMRAEDFKPDRMEAAKARVKEFAANYKGGRMALVAFAGRSFTQCPLTQDGGILEGLIDQLGVGSVELDGTAIGDAILNCVNKFKDEAGSRVIILLTDGENNAGIVEPLTAARVAADKGIRIYTIGMGTAEGAPVPAFGPMGEKFYLREPSGGVIMAKVDEASLRSIAETTGGRYFRAVDEDALGEVYRNIAELEKKEIKIKRPVSYRELFPYPAGAGLLLMVIGGALGAGRYRVL